MKTKRCSDRILTTTEVARWLRVHEYRIQELARKDLIPHFRLGRQLRFRATSIREFMAAGGKPLPGGWRKEDK